MDKGIFARKKSGLNRGSLILEAALLCLLILAIGLLFRNSRLIMSKSQAENSWDAARMREYANKLKADGLIDQSIRAYEEYAKNGGIDNATRSNIYFSLGEILMKAGRYEDALAYFYKAEIANPDSGLKQELGTNIVVCLEKSNRSLDAEYQMESRTLLDKNSAIQKPSGEVVAKIKNREITMNEINRAIEQLPVWMKEAYDADELKKLEFLKTYVANELFYEKGVKLGYGKDPEIRRQADALEKELVIQKLLDNEVLGKIKAAEDDLKNYYEVNKDDYTEKAAIKFKYILAATEDEAKALIKQLESGADFEKLAKERSIDEATKKDGGVVPGWVYETGYIPSVGYEKDLVKGLFNLPDDQKPHVVKTEKGFYVAEITDKKAERVKSFEEAKSQVKASYEKEKSDKAMRKFMDDILAVKDVKIYSEKFTAPKKPEEKEKITAPADKNVSEKKNKKEAK